MLNQSHINPTRKYISILSGNYNNTELKQLLYLISSIPLALERIIGASV